MKKILYCTDGSEISEFALKKVLGLLKKDFEIDIVTISDSGFLTNFITFPYETETAFPDYKNEAEIILDRAKALIEMENYKVGEKIHLAGNPGDNIISLSEKGIYEAIILGSHGKKGFKKWLGSVSRKVANKSPIPVFIVKPLKRKEDGAEKEILFATDGSQYAYNAVKKTLEIIELAGSSIEVLSVKAGEDDFPIEIRSDKDWLKKCLTRQDEIMNEILEKTSVILENQGLSVNQKTLLEGDPAAELLKYLIKHPKDLIIMGSHGREGISSVLLGSVSKVILDNTDSPVLIIHNKIITQLDL